MPQPVYFTATIDEIGVLGRDTDPGDAYFISTGSVGATCYIDGIHGDGIQDGTEYKVFNLGPNDVVLRHNTGSAGEKLFLPSGTNRTLTPTGSAYWLVRSSVHPIGDGWSNGEDP